MFKGSWKTSVLGIGGLLVVLFNSILAPMFDADPLTVPHWDVFFAALSSAGIGFFARDNNVSSEQAGAK